MKKILVPIDFSDHSEYALEVAAKLAKTYNADIVALHMMGLSEAILTKDESQEVMEAVYYMKLAEKQFGEFLDKDYLEGVNVVSTVQNYKIFKEIDTVAREHEADLIVMGSHGSSGIREVFVGSNTEKVVRTSTVPVLVVKNKVMDFEVGTMVFACDFSLDYLPAFKKAMEIASLFNAKFQLLYINTPERFKRSSEMQQRAFKFLTEAGDNALDLYDSVVYYCDTTIEDGIFAYSNNVRADVIAVPTHGRRGLAHFFTGSIGEELVNHSDIPVITFKI
ncbi:MAG: universal stress protein [Flavobacteriaceae bacterium]|nr:universal stress protein [Flavobacteriaceae bacterium]